MGLTSESDPPSVVIIGSSAACGQGESLPVADGIGDAGYIARLISNRCGYSKMALPGDRLAWRQPDGVNRRLAALAALNPKFVIWQLGDDDISAGVSAARMQTDLVALVGGMADRRRPPRRLPRTPGRPRGFLSVGTPHRVGVIPSVVSAEQYFRQ